MILAIPACLFIATCVLDSGEWGRRKSGNLDPKKQEGTLATVALGNCVHPVMSAFIGLQEQVAEKFNCVEPGTMKSLSSLRRVKVAPGRLAELQAAAYESLAKIVAARKKTLAVRSARRTVAEQYVLHEWMLQDHRCGVSVSKKAGESNHLSGLAIDIEDDRGWRKYFEKYGWKWYGPEDPVHFDYIAPDGRDLRPSAVRAFQLLLNENNPDAPLAVTGVIDDNTEAQIAAAPRSGFAQGASCGTVDESGWINASR